MPEPAKLRFDCLVIGGGPAGSVLAGTLAQWGKSVALVDRGDRHAVFPEETLVPGATAALQRVGAMASIRAHRFWGTDRHGILWGNDRIEWRKSDDSTRGYKVERDVFDRDLRAIAKGMGAQVFDRHIVRGRLPIDAEAPLRLCGPDGSERPIAATVVVVAGGKSVSPHLLDLELVQQLPQTTALGCIADAAGAFENATVVEAVGAGWLWWLPLRTGQVSIALFADTDEIRRTGAEALFREALASSAGPAKDSSLRPAFGLQATPRLVRNPRGVLLIGDAASSIDPLSSQGIEKAISSAEQAAVAVNTVIEKPDLTDIVLRHHQAFEAGVFRSHAGEALGHYHLERRFADRPFWQKRHNAGAAARSIASPSLPEFVVASPKLERRDTMRRKGRLFERVAGFALNDDERVLEALGVVPLEPVFRLLRHAPRVERFLELAAREADFALANRRLITEALTRLLELGMIAPKHGFVRDESRGREDDLPKNPGP